MKVRVLGAHNLESRDTRLACVLIDGLITIDAGGLTSTLTFEEQLRLKAVLITHHHYDHLKDLPMIGLTFSIERKHLAIYATSHVYDTLRYILRYPEKLYSNTLERPTGNPTLRFTAIEPLVPFQVDGYRVVAVPVSHSVPAVGFEVTAPDGRKLFYTGDTGSGLDECWRHISPDLLIIENTASDRYLDAAKNARHLSPSLLKEELLSFRRLKGYLPRVITTHMFPQPQEVEERKLELERVSDELGISITPAYEGMEIEV